MQHCFSFLICLKTAVEATREHLGISLIISVIITYVILIYKLYIYAYQNHIELNSIIIHKSNVFKFSLRHNKYLYLLTYVYMKQLNFNIKARIYVRYTNFTVTNFIATTRSEYQWISAAQAFYQSKDILKALCGR